MPLTHKAGTFERARISKLITRHGRESWRAVEMPDAAGNVTDVMHHSEIRMETFRCEGGYGPGRYRAMHADPDKKGAIGYFTVPAVAPIAQPPEPEQSPLATVPKTAEELLLAKLAQLLGGAAPAQAQANPMAVVEAYKEGQAQGVALTRDMATTSVQMCQDAFKFASDAMASTFATKEQLGKEALAQERAHQAAVARERAAATKHQHELALVRAENGSGETSELEKQLGEMAGSMARTAATLAGVEEPNAAE